MRVVLQTCLLFTRSAYCGQEGLTGDDYINTPHGLRRMILPKSPMHISSTTTPRRSLTENGSFDCSGGQVTGCKDVVCEGYTSCYGIEVFGQPNDAQDPFYTNADCTDEASCKGVIFRDAGDVTCSGVESCGEESTIKGVGPLECGGDGHCYTAFVMHCPASKAPFA